MSEILKDKIVTIIEDFKGVDIRVFCVKEILSYTDWVIIVTGTSNRHVKTIASKLQERVKHELDIKTIGVEGETEGEWVLVDFGAAIVHVMIEDTRNYYQIEQLYL